jgi:hypothetical protein
LRRMACFSHATAQVVNSTVGVHDDEGRQIEW